MPKLSEIAQSLQELERMHQLNLELLEQLNVIFEFVMQNNIAIPNKEKLSSLLLRTQALLKELYFSKPQLLSYRKLTTQRKFTEEKPDGDFTEPVLWFC
jgi:hypothetical protein